MLYQPDSGRYIIVWQQGGDVYSRGILPDGTLAGGAITLADTTQFETNPRLTADLILWQRQNTGTGYDLYARPLDNSGLPAGEPFVIQEAPGNQQNPALAAGSHQRYQLAWQDDATGPWDLFTAVLDRRYQVTHIAYEYDPLYRLTNAIYSGDISAAYEYTYDAVGNMTAYTETIGTATSSVNRTFNAANQLLVSVDSQAGSSTFTYDNNGNLERINLPGFADEKLLYAYNQRNLLTLVSRQFGYTAPQEEAAFVYDGDGNRLQQIDYTGSQPVITTYTNDILGLSQVLVSSNGTTTTYNLFGLDLISQDDASQTRYLLTDGLGSTRMEMVGNAVETATTYEPYGRLLAQTGATGTVYGFTGEEYDDVTGLVYLRARYYNPYLNQFQSRDPYPGEIWQPSTLHSYAYVYNSPTNYIDPTGLIRWRNTGSLQHWVIENHYERIPLNSFKQLEYPIPGGGVVDMFNSFFGDVFEIEPVHLRNAPHGVAQASRYAAQLNNAASRGRLPTIFGINWNDAFYHLGGRADWPGKLRVPYPGYPDIVLVADYAEPGLILYWYERRSQVPETQPVLVPNPRDLRIKNWHPNFQFAPIPIPNTSPPIPVPPWANPPSNDIPDLKLPPLWPAPLAVELVSFEASPLTSYDWCQDIWQKIRNLWK